MPVSLPIIAVFGSNKPNDNEPEAARLLGKAIGRQGAIILTGGTWKDSPKKIKDIAIKAAEGSNTTADDPVWIAVANESYPAPWKESHRGGVLTPGGNHERNFVEACLCHAAIAIGASEGTSSEAIFALYLNRPVALVNVPNTVGLEATMQAFKAAACKRINPTDDGNPVRKGIRQAYEWVDEPDSSFCYQPLPRTDAEADAIVKGLLRTIGKAEDRPAWPRLSDAGIWAAFVEASITAAGR